MLATLQAEIVVAQCKTEAKAVDMSTALMTSSENAAVKEVHVTRMTVAPKKKVVSFLCLWHVYGMSICICIFGCSCLYEGFEERKMFSSLRSTFFIMATSLEIF